MMTYLGLVAILGQALLPLADARKLGYDPYHYYGEKAGAAAGKKTKAAAGKKEAKAASEPASSLPDPVPAHDPVPAYDPMQGTQPQMPMAGTAPVQNVMNINVPANMMSWMWCALHYLISLWSFVQNTKKVGSKW